MGSGVEKEGRAERSGRDMGKGKELPSQILPPEPPLASDLPARSPSPAVSKRPHLGKRGTPVGRCRSEGERRGVGRDVRGGAGQRYGRFPHGGVPLPPAEMDSSSGVCSCDDSSAVNTICRRMHDYFTGVDGWLSILLQPIKNLPTGLHYS
ncbi:hypothetical protein OsJ_32722 [Oryza sativa Japonica Group]|uniref:Uncharacterized protein n=1 Tax=Oryza sativa subsp. japonica TaxID=39947 RepID=B9G920_ORYSJ|nr:hypothetical protein OsJ_32722 [Oryza sativa Japonica Group]